MFRIILEKICTFCMLFLQNVLILFYSCSKSMTQFYIYAVFFSPCLIIVFWCIFENTIKPSLIPEEEIQKIIEQIYKRHGPQAFPIACHEEYRAWYEGNLFAHGRWRRIRHTMTRMGL